MQGVKDYKLEAAYKGHKVYHGRGNLLSQLSNADMEISLLLIKRSVNAALYCSHQDGENDPPDCVGLNGMRSLPASLPIYTEHQRLLTLLSALRPTNMSAALLLCLILLTVLAWAAFLRRNR